MLISTIENIVKRTVSPISAMYQPVTIPSWDSVPRSVEIAISTINTTNMPLGKSVCTIAATPARERAI